MSFDVGSRVETEKNGKGRVAFCGSTQFADGEWVGVILDEAKGKNNGTVQGVPYFSCEPNYGLFVKSAQLKLEVESSRGPRRSIAPGLKAPTSALRKDSTAKSPIASPKMSPAASKENIAKGLASSKKSSASKLSDLSQERKVAAKPSQLAKEPPKMSRENSRQPSPQPSAAPAEAEPAAVKQPTVGDLVKKVEEKVSVPSTPVHMIHPPMSFEDSTQVERLRVEIRDLTEKLDTLRIKRKEDQQRIKELEIESQKVQSLMQVRTKLADENKDLMRQLEEARMELDGLREWKNIHHEQLASSSQQLEMYLIDKEMAEEKADMLRRDNEVLKEQMEELKTNLEILQEEMATAGSGGGAPVGNSVQMKQLEAQNEKLKQAVIKVRDLYDSVSAGKADAERELSEKDDEILELLEAGEIYKKQAEEAEKRIQEYQEQADAALGAEEMVTVLTSKNLEMEERIEQLEAEKDELEAIHDMDEQLAETQMAIEKDLRKEMEGLNGKIRELIQKLLAEEKHNDDLMKTIMKFREKTAVLNEQLQDRDDQILRYEEVVSGQQTEEKSAASLALQQQVNAAKSFLEQVERQLNGLELEYSRKHMGYLRAFLPDNFMKPGGDNDAVLLNVIFPRLIAKAALFPRLVTDKFPTVPGGMRREHITKSHKAEQWGQSAKVSYLCSSLSTVCSQFDSAIQRMSVESLVRLSQLQLEISAHEKSVDSYIDLLKQGRFDENTALDSLKKGINYFLSSISVNVGFDGFSYKKYLESLTRQMGLATTWMKLSSQRIAYSLTPGSDGSDVHGFISHVNLELEQCEQAISRIGKHIPETEFKIQQQILEEAQATIMMLERLADLLHDVSTVASVQVSMNTEKDGLDATRLKEIIHSAVEKSFGSTLLEKTYDPVEKHLLGMRSGLTELLSVFEKGNFSEEPENKQTFPPMLERAHLRKQGAAEAEGLRWQLEKKDGEIQELRKNVKGKLDEIGNLKHRLELTEGRMNTSGQQVTAKTKLLEERIDQLNLDLNKQKIDFEQTQERLSQDIKELQKENDELKKAKNTMSKMALYQSVQSHAAAAAASSSVAASPTRAAAGHSGATTDSPATRAELQLLELSLEESQRSLRAANLELIRLRSENVIKSVGAELPDVVCGPETLRATKGETLLDVLYKEAEHLKREELKYSVFIPDLSKPLAKQKEERERFQQARERISSRIGAVRARLHRYWAEENPGVPFPTRFRVDRPVAAAATGQSESCAAETTIKFNSEAFHKILNKWGAAK